MKLYCFLFRLILSFLRWQMIVNCIEMLVFFFILAFKQETVSRQVKGATRTTISILQIINGMTKKKKQV